MKRALIIVLVAVLAAAAWLLLWAKDKTDAESWSGVLESREIQVGSRVGGRVVEVLVQEGQMVEAGAVLIRLERREWGQRYRSSARWNVEWRLRRIGSRRRRVGWRRHRRKHR